MTVTRRPPQPVADERWRRARAMLADLRGYWRGADTLRLLAAQQMSAGDEQIGQRAGDQQAMRVLLQPAIAHLGKAEHPLDDPDRVLDFGPHVRLGAVFHPLGPPPRAPYNFEIGMVAGPTVVNPDAVGIIIQIPSLTNLDENSNELMGNTVAYSFWCQRSDMTDFAQIGGDTLNAKFTYAYQKAYVCSFVG